MPLAMGFNQFKDAANSAIDSIDVEEFTGAMSTETTMYANDGTTILAKFFAQDRITIPLEDVSVNLQNAVIAKEDKRFWDHSGLDPIGLLRGFVNSYISRGDSELQGGSTITQQYVKNLLIDMALQDDDPIAAYHAKEQTIYRKLKEAKFAFEVEQKMDKHQILEGYLNVAPFGPNVYGAEASARNYFSKHASELNIGEAALLAGVTRSPVDYDPLTYPEVAQEQRDIVLNAMADQNYITKQERDEFVAVDLTDMLNPQTVPMGCATAGVAAFFCDYVTNSILNDEKFGRTKSERRRFLYQRGLSIYTTLDPAFQSNASEVVSKTIPPEDKSGIENALVTVEPGTGKILAMAQNRPYNGAQTDPYAIDTAVNYSVGQKEGGSNGFSPGSTFKPIILTQWLKEGHSLYETPPNKYPYNPTQFACTKYFAPPYDPKNANGGTTNTTPLSALQQSLNIPFINMATVTGLCTIFQTAKEMGFWDSAFGDPTDPQNPQTLQPSALIGATNATPLTMANVYATIVSGGIHCNPTAITKIVDSSEIEHSVPSSNCKRVVDEDVATAVTWALNQNTKSGLATGAAIPGFDTGAKTGTAENAYMLWTIGFVKQAVTAVWVGNAQYDQRLCGFSIGGVWPDYQGCFISGGLPMRMWKSYTKSVLEAKGFENIPIDKPDNKFLYRTVVPDDKKDDNSGTGQRNPAAAVTQDQPIVSTPVTNQPAPTVPTAPNPPAGSSNDSDSGRRLEGVTFDR